MRDLAFSSKQRFVSWMNFMRQSGTETVFGLFLLVEWMRSAFLLATHLFHHQPWSLLLVATVSHFCEKIPSLYRTVLVLRWDGILRWDVVRGKWNAHKNEGKTYFVNRGKFGVLGSFIAPKLFPAQKCPGWIRLRVLKYHLAACGLVTAWHVA